MSAPFAFNDGNLSSDKTNSSIESSKSWARAQVRDNSKASVSLAFPKTSHKALAMNSGPKPRYAT